ncbi:hypothetical protein ACI6Q2_23545, partial [Chitinophagaceae bacterium LWZ2-11]
DSIINTVKAKGDTLTGDKFIKVIGGNGATLVNANTSLDTKALANDSSFITNLVVNKQFKDSVTNVVINNNSFDSSITKVVRDSVSNWYTNNTILR